MSFTKNFEKTAAMIPGVSEDFYEDKAKQYYGLMHSPLLTGIKTGLKYGLPAAAIASLVSPSGKRAFNALAGGLLIGGPLGSFMYMDQKYRNMLEKAHMLHHMES